MAQVAGAIRYMRRNLRLVVGIVLLLILFLFAFVGRLVVDLNDAYPLSAPANLAPSWEYPFGTDSQGRDLLAVAVAGTYLTTKIGVIAGSLGLGFGTILGFMAAYYGGVLDTIVRWVVDVLLTIPSLLVLVVIASTFQGGIDVNGMALVVAILSWMWPARVIRSQVLTMKQRAFVRVAQLSGSSNLEIIFKELMPNLLPFLGASLVGSVTGAIFASLGLEALGLGPMREPTLGMTIYWVMYYGAFVRGMWWWIMNPIIIIVILFVGLFLLSAGLDELANPRLRRRV
ncbi:MAG TPA: ABC transporter permease [Chloroflexi bacterium]|jgi:peptide/nickel transport system permease protein|nr:ABC transporter permease [Chloroflexota bacterium]